MRPSNVRNTPELSMAQAFIAWQPAQPTPCPDSMVRLNTATICRRIDSIVHGDIGKAVTLYRQLWRWKITDTGMDAPAVAHSISAEFPRDSDNFRTRLLTVLVTTLSKKAQRHARALTRELPWGMDVLDFACVFAGDAFRSDRLLHGLRVLGKHKGVDFATMLYEVQNQASGRLEQAARPEPADVTMGAVIQLADLLKALDVICGRCSMCRTAKGEWSHGRKKEDKSIAGCTPGPASDARAESRADEGGTDSGTQAAPAPSADQERALDHSQQHELAQARQRELEQARQRELEDAQQRQVEDARRREIEQARQQELEQTQQREREEAQQRELEDARQQELEVARQRELEDARRREIEQARQQELEQTQQREREEAQQRELEDARQQELEQARQREVEQTQQQELVNAEQRQVEQARQRDLEQARRRELDQIQARELEQAQQRQPEHAQQHGPGTDQERGTEQGRSRQDQQLEIDDPSSLFQLDDVTEHDTAASLHFDDTFPADSATAAGRAPGLLPVQGSLYQSQQNCSGVDDAEEQRTGSSNDVEDLVIPGEVNNMSQRDTPRAPTRGTYLRRPQVTVAHVIKAVDHIQPPGTSAARSLQTEAPPPHLGCDFLEPEQNTHTTSSSAAVVDANNNQHKHSNAHQHATLHTSKARDERAAHEFTETMSVTAQLSKKRRLTTSPTATMPSIHTIFSTFRPAASRPESELARTTRFSPKCSLWSADGTVVCVAIAIANDGADRHEENWALAIVKRSARTVTIVAQDAESAAQAKRTAMTQLPQWLDSGGDEAPVREPTTLLLSDEFPDSPRKDSRHLVSLLAVLKASGVNSTVIHPDLWAEFFNVYQSLLRSVESGQQHTPDTLRDLLNKVLPAPEIDLSGDLLSEAGAAFLESDCALRHSVRQVELLSSFTENVKVFARLLHDAITVASSSDATGEIESARTNVEDCRKMLGKATHSSPLYNALQDELNTLEPQLVVLQSKQEALSRLKKVIGDWRLEEAELEIALPKRVTENKRITQAVLRAALEALDQV